MVSILRQRWETHRQKNKDKAIDQKAGGAESLENLIFDTLKRKLIDLERQKQLAASGFIYMNPARQKRVLAEASKLNEKIEKIEEIIKEHCFSDSIRR